MQLPHFDDLIQEQLSVYDTPPEQSLFVIGPPGSGKTTLAVLRAQLLSRMKKRTLFITKNRMLAALATQLSNGHFDVMTMHSFVPRDYRSRISGNIPQVRSYVFDWPNIMNDYANSPSVASYEHIVVDEGQNLPKGFYPWVVRYGADAISVFADEAQTTDLQQNASIQDILDAPMPKERHLLENHRNTLEIALVAEHFHRSQKVAPGLVRRRQSGTKPSLVRFTDWSEVAQRVAIRYRNRGESIGVIVKYVNEAEHLQHALQKLLSEDDRVDVYTNGTQRGLEHNINVTSSGITILTSESVIGLEFECVYLQDLHRSSSALSIEQNRRMYMLCARARDELILLDGPTPMTQAELNNLPDEKLLTR